MVNILDIPEEIIKHISTFLMIEDVIHLSMTCKYLFYILPCYSIEENVFEGPNLELSETSTPLHHLPYFDIPPFMSHVFMLKIYSEKRFLNIVRLQLIRPDVHSNEQKIVTKSDFRLTVCTELADAKKFLSIKHPILQAIKPGDYFRFIFSNFAWSTREGRKGEIKGLRIHTRGLRCGQRVNQESTKHNTLIRTNHEFHRFNKRILDNVPKMFEQQDKDALIPEWLYILEQTVDFFSR